MSDAHFNEAQLLSAFRELEKDAASSRTFNAHAVALVIYAFVDFFDRWNASPIDREKLTRALRETKSRGGSHVSIPLAIAEKFILDQRPRFAAIEKKIAEEAAAAETAGA